MGPTLCPFCFRNFGVRFEAERLASEAEVATCSSCGHSGSGTLDHESAKLLMHRFFVTGSIPPEIGGPAPVYQFNNAHPRGRVEFLTELDHDRQVLEDFLDAALFHYGPPLWRLGYTEHYQRLREDPPIGRDERRRIWDDIIGRCVTRTIGADTRIFRIRVGSSLPPALPEQFDTAPRAVAIGGRYDSSELPVFYGADDIETCLHESRATLSDWIALATFCPARPLRLLDLSRDVDDSKARTPFERVDILLEKLAYVGKGDYDLCRELAVEVKNRAFDGFYFVSYFSQAHARGLRNVALFGYPVRDEKLSLVSVNRVRLTSMAFDFSLGPSNDNSIPIEQGEMLRLAERMRSGDVSVKEAADEMERILARKSTTPR